MREIKFRAWDKESKMFFYWGFIRELNTKNFIFQGIPTHLNLSMLEIQNISQQFTGLKDNNGKEIFEGDFVDFGNSNGFSWGTEYFKLEVVFIDCRFAFKNIKSGKIFDKNITQEIIKDCDTFKVIGNKFENPELLEDKDDEI